MSNTIRETQHGGTKTAEKKQDKDTAFIFVCAVVTLIVVVLNTFVMQLALVNGSSMQPTLENRQLLLMDKTYRFGKSFQRGDVVVFKNDGSYLIKRVVALPGETIQIIDNDIYINGEKIQDFVDVEMEDYGLLAEPLTLGEDEYFCLGDNRNNSRDCRHPGAIQKSKIQGKVILRFSPWSTDF